MVDFILQNIFAFHKQLQAAEGIRERNLIESAVNAPFQTFGGQALYPTIFDKAARLFFGLVKNHGFIDGNKRVAVHALIVFLRVNGFLLDTTDDDIFNVTMKVARSEMTPDEIKLWLLKRTAGTITFSGKITIRPSD